MAINIPIAIIAIIAMAIITFILRAFPLLVPKKILESRYLKLLNVAFPISVMMLLILNSLGIDLNDIKHVEITAKLIALVIVFFSYYWWKNVFISIIVGVAFLNGLLYLFSLFSDQYSF